MNFPIKNEFAIDINSNTSYDKIDSKSDMKSVHTDMAKANKFNNNMADDLTS